MAEKKGPKPKAGDRYDCGKRRPTDFRSEAQFQRMKANAMSLGLDPIMTSQAGRLLYMGELTARHMATVDYIARVYARHAKHVGKEMTRRLRSPSYEPSTNHSERLDENDDTALDAIEAKEEFESLQACIPDYPREARDCIERICVDDEAIPSAWVKDLAVLLTMIEEKRDGVRSSTRLGRTGLPLRKRAPPLTRDEKLAKGLYAAAPKHTRPSDLTGEAAEAAARDREGLERMLNAGNERREQEAAP